MLIAYIIFFSSLFRSSFASVVGLCTGTSEEDGCKCAFTDGVVCEEGNYCPEIYDPTSLFMNQTLVDSGCTIVNGVIQCPCTPGFYCPANASEPIYCCSAYHCPTPARIKPCPAGFFCRTGFVEPLECPFKDSCPERSDKAPSVGAWAILIVSMCLLAILLLIQEFFKKRRRALQALAMEKKPEEVVGDVAVAVVRAVKETDHEAAVVPKKDNDIVEFKSPLVTKAHKNRESDVELHDESAHKSTARSTNTSFYIEFINIEFTLPNGISIMKDVSGHFQPGRICAVMGPSGAGKTTIINLVSGKVPKTSGVVLVNGVLEDGLSKYRKLFGFVPQEDVMIRELSVREVISHSAMMRLPRSMSRQEKEDRIVKCLKDLGISHIQHSPIGDERERGISGGQRKRVNIAIELVTDPVVLFLDEPTSGLDSSTSTSLCKTLKIIAQERSMTIVAVIHQPSLTAFHEFDDLLLLGKGGRTVFHGPTQQAPLYFKDIGFTMPSNVNPADYYLDVTSGGVKRESDPGFKFPQLFDLWDTVGLNYLPESIKSKRDGMGISAGDDVTPQAIHSVKENLIGGRVMSNEGGRQSEAVSRMIESAHVQMEKENNVFANFSTLAVDFVSNQVQEVKEFGTNVLVGTKEAVMTIGQPDPVRDTPDPITQFLLCFHRSCLQVFKSKKAFFMEQLLHFGCGLFISVAAKDLEYIGPYPDVICATTPLPFYHACRLPQSDNYTQIGNFLAWGIGFAGIAAAAGTFGNEQVNYWRESAAGLSTMPYFFAKILADFPRIFFAAVFFFAAFMTRFQTTGNLSDVFLIVLLLYWFGFALGYLVSQVVPISKAALTGVLLALVFSIAISGSNPSMKEVNDYPSSRSWLWDISGPRWALEAFYVNEVKFYKTVHGGPLDGEKYIDISSGLDNRGYDVNAVSSCLTNIFLCGLGWGSIALVLMLLTYSEKKR